MPVKQKGKQENKDEQKNKRGQRLFLIDKFSCEEFQRVIPGTHY